MIFDFSKKPGKIVLNRGSFIDEEPLVSVVTPYYNAEKYFRELYPCVLNQTFPWFEWIIVDDGSDKKEDFALLKKVEKEDTRIHVVHKKNGGISSARNCGIRKSRTDIIITLDADELIEPTYFEVLYWALYYNPKASWAYTDSVGFQNQEYVWQHPWDAKKLKTYNFLVESAAIRKESLLEVGCYDEVEKHYFEDWRLWLKLLSKGKFPVHISSLEFWYRRTDTGVLNTVVTDTNIKRRADRLIEEVAATADETVQAKTFNKCMSADFFELPKKSTFTKKYFEKQDKKKILFIIPWMITGGADQFNLDFVKLINKTKYEVIIITTEKSDNSWEQKFRQYVTEIYKLPDFLDKKNYAEFITYIIQTRQIDVCFVSNSYYGYYILPWLKREYPSLAIIDYVHMEEMYWRKGGYARTSMAMSDLIEKTYVCNNSTKKAFIDKFNRQSEKVETIYIGVDQNKFDPQKIEFGMVRKKYQIPSEGKIVLFPCRLHKQKRPYLMIEIARRVVELDNRIYFLVVGDGDELLGMQQKVSEYRIEKNVIFAGMQEDIRPFYRDSDVTLICSLREGLSLTAYESCSMMTPVITADVGGQRELIDENVGCVLPMLQDEKNIHATQYSMQEVLQYVTAIFSLLDEKNYAAYQKKCLLCRKKVEEKFGLDSMIRKMESAIDECFSGERIEKRNRCGYKLENYPNLTADMLAMFLAYEGSIEENKRIWQERCYFQGQIGGLQGNIEQMNIEKNNIEDSYRAISNSISFRIGRCITAIPRKIRGGFWCIRDHGFGYTSRYAIKKIFKL